MLSVLGTLIAIAVVGYIAFGLLRESDQEGVNQKKISELTVEQVMRLLIAGVLVVVLIYTVSDLFGG
jgi:hypothetical protein